MPEVVYSTKDLIEKIDRKLDLIVSQIQSKADRSELAALQNTVNANKQEIVVLREKDDEKGKHIEKLYELDKNRSRWILGIISGCMVGVLGFALAVLESSGGL